MHQRLMRMRQLETEEEETIGVMTRLLHAQADRNLMMFLDYTLCGFTRKYLLGHQKVGSFV